MNRISLWICAVLPLTAQPVRLRPEHFKWRAEVQVLQAADHVSIRPDRALYARTESQFRDLRIFGPSGREIAWALRGHQLAGPRTASSARMLDLVQTRAGSLQFVLDFGPAPPIHNRLRFETSDSDFRRPLRIESSLDRRQWDFVRTAALLRFDENGQRVESLAVDYPDSFRRYLRVTIENWEDPRSLISVTPEAGIVNMEQWEPLGSARPQTTELQDQRSTQFDAAFPFGALADARLSVVTKATGFVRSARVSSSADARAWTLSGTHSLYRVPGGEQLWVRCPSVNAAHLRLTLFNADNPPIAVDEIRLEVPVRELVFAALDPGVYRLYLGRAVAAEPDYDLDDILARSGPIRPASLAAGPWGPNPDYVPPARPSIPFTERFPWLLPSVVAAAVLLMGAAAYRLLRSAA